MIFLVVGYKNVQGAKTGDNVRAEEYFTAPSAAALEAHLLAQPLSAGGFTSFSVHEVDALPSEVEIVCPNCSHRIVDERKVTHVTEKPKLGVAPK